MMKLFVKTGCPWCVEATTFLDRGGFEYTAVDVRSDAAAMAEMQQVSGQTLAPTLVAGGRVLADFDVAQLRAFFAEHCITPPHK